MAPNSEVTAKAKRRRFTGEYKRRILREADALSEIGGISEWLRREGRYGKTARRDLCRGRRVTGVPTTTPYMTRIEKLEAARRNLAAAVRLFFERGDPIAIHTLAAAAQGVIRDVARGRGLAYTSILHDHPDIPAESQKEWIKILNASRNFFKHADADLNGTLEFDESANEILLLDACLVLSELSGHALSEANVYIGWFTTANSSLRSALSNNQIGEYAVRNDISPQDFNAFRELCGAKLLIEPTRSSS